jgi:hypothetical protein
MGASQRRCRRGVNVERPQRASARTNDVEARKARDTIGWPWGERCHAGRLQALCRISDRRRTKIRRRCRRAGAFPDLGEPSLTAKPGNRFTVRTAKDGLVAVPRLGGGLSMSHIGKSHLVIMATVGADDVAEGDRLFARHGEWMKGHPREGDVALLSYTISKGPELSNPMDPNSEPTGRTTFVIDEYYESPAGIARHWQESMNWPEMSSDVPAWMAKATVVTLHNGTVVQALW